MADVKPEQAQQFHEEDEDPTKVFAVLDTAKREGHLRQTEPPKPPPLRQFSPCWPASFARIFASCGSVSEQRTSSNA
jgi:hypothetical protein